MSHALEEDPVALELTLQELQAFGLRVQPGTVLTAEDWAISHSLVTTLENVTHQFEAKVCPDSRCGKLDRLPDLGKTLRLIGRPCLQATVWEPDQFRCGACGEVFPAPLPDEALGPKYDETAGGMIAVLKYGTGLPNQRLDQLLKDRGIPVPATTQSEICTKCWTPRSPRRTTHRRRARGMHES